MRASEIVAATAFVYFAVVCWHGDMRLARRLQVTAASLLVLGLIRFMSLQAALFRDWAPALYILAGYYVSGMTFVRPSEPLEHWLMGWDRRWLDDPTTRFSGWPPLLLAYLDFVYTMTFLLLPAGLAVILVVGRRDLVDRYWTIVTAAELGAFTPLALIQTRPPWVLEKRADLPDGAMRRMAERAVQQMSIGVNTFPSGHAAGAFGIALAVYYASPAAGFVFAVIAASISVACVVGRYHYVVDVIAGIALTLAVWGVTMGLGI